MTIGKQLMRNLENSSKYERKHEEFQANLMSFQQNHREKDYKRTQNAMKAMTQNKKVLHAEKRY